MSLKDLQERREKLLVEARERLDQVTKNTDESRSAELETQHDAAMAELDKVTGLIEREERLSKMEERAQSARENRRPTLGDGEARGDGAGEPEITYRSVFAKIVCGVAPGDLEPEERAVLKAGVSDLKGTGLEKRMQTAGTTTAGGYTVPTELLAIIQRTMAAWGPMYNEDICTVLTTTSGNALKMPTVDDTSVVAVAHTEGTALTDDGGSDVTFGQKSLDAYGFDTEFVKFSWELGQDSIFAMETLLGDLLGERLSRIANSQLTTGTGSSAPNGIVTASSLGKTSASATAITADELIDLVHSVDPAYRASPKARFMFNDSTLKAIRKLKDGQGNYLWQMGDVTKGVPGSLLGYNYSINQAMASIPASASASKVAVFGDFSKYYVRKVGAPVIGVLRERFWPDVGIAGLIRFDGELGVTGSIKHLITAAS